MGDLLDDVDLAREPATEPPKRWKNRWVAIEAHDAACWTCGAVVGFEKGDVIESHCRIYPSKDAAITDAARLAPPDDSARDYLGAFPVPE